MTEHIVLAGVSRHLLREPYPGLTFHRVNNVDDLWDVMTSLNTRLYGENTLVVVGDDLRPSPGRLAVSVFEVAYHLRCLSHYMATVFYGRAETWIIHELVQKYCISAYVDTAYPEELDYAIRNALSGHSFYCSKSLNYDPKMKAKGLKWQHAFVLQATAERNDTEQIKFAANLDNDRKVYNITESLRKRFNVTANAALPARLVQAGYFLT